MLNHNIFAKICSKIEMPHTIYKVVEYKGGTNGYTKEEYFYEEEEAYQYLRDEYIKTLAYNLAYYKNKDQVMYETAGCTYINIEEDSSKIRSIFANKYDSNQEMARQIYDDILIDKVKQGIKIIGGYRINFSIEAGNIR